MKIVLLELAATVGGVKSAFFFFLPLSADRVTCVTAALLHKDPTLMNLPVRPIVINLSSSTFRLSVQNVIVTLKKQHETLQFYLPFSESARRT